MVVSHIRSATICHETNTYPIVRAKQEGMASPRRNTRRPLTELCLEAKEAAKSNLRFLPSGDKIMFG